MAPGVVGGIGALIAEKRGFKAAYLSGSQVAGMMGLPDLSVTTMNEVAEEVQRITAISRLPLIVDVDTGFGEVVNVIRTVRVMEASGASAIHMEDQELPKKCGHLNGKKVIDRDEMIRKISAAASARKNEDFMIIARTDARAVNGLEDAIDRANAYLEAGADAIFTEALESKEEFEKMRKQVKGYLLANMTEDGKSPLLSVDDLRSIGYNIVIFPLTAFRTMLKAIDSIYADIKNYGTQRNSLDKIMRRAEFYDLIGYYDYEKEDNVFFEIKK
ncbi:carboxyphosphonoenolpyruvate phosphonomutase [Thermoplasma volcanium GSS1]|uniref:Methylisocitrate lyase n=1 Tax=Thermoplasma volcanium (strain ATCC 51530 / DSM 4299 / JCM 9571 / NBRC 15438 / GSS1) TaxID=273116 RepID=Q97BT3_THEVO|nr:carboxyphosphonoenolpyruvate phosphonomutase [Thermoplasma volcanium GSS1]